MKNKAIGTVIVIIIVIVVVAGGIGGYMVMSGSDEAAPTDNDTSTDTGTSTDSDTFSGTWKGTEIDTGEQVSGTWEFTADWFYKEVSGSIDGDATGDIDGSVVGGSLSVQGKVSEGKKVTFTAEGVSSDKSEISGEWEIRENVQETGSSTLLYEGTWSGQKE